LKIQRRYSDAFFNCHAQITLCHASSLSVQRCMALR
jgi:hypothetical protein